MEIEKTKIQEADIILLERASLLKVISSFEKDIINNMVSRYLQYGQKMVITKSQQEILIQLSDRYINSRDLPGIR